MEFGKNRQETWNGQIHSRLKLPSGHALFVFELRLQVLQIVQQPPMVLFVILIHEGELVDLLHRLGITIVVDCLVQRRPSPVLSFIGSIPLLDHRSRVLDRGARGFLMAVLLPLGPFVLSLLPLGLCVLLSLAHELLLSTGTCIGERLPTSAAWNTMVSIKSGR